MSPIEWTFPPKAAEIHACLAVLVMDRWLGQACKLQFPDFGGHQYNPRVCPLRAAPFAQPNSGNVGPTMAASDRH